MEHAQHPSTPYARPLAPPVPAGAHRGPDDGRARARAAGARRLAAMRARTRRIRRVIAAGSAALVIALFALLYVQLASGHDPALVAVTKRHAVSNGSSGPARGSSSSSESSEVAESSSSSGTSSGIESSSSSGETAASSVTTGQS